MQVFFSVLEKEVGTDSMLAPLIQIESKKIASETGSLSLLPMYVPFKV